MLFWHLGITLLAVRYIYRDPAMDLRWVAAGSLLPDLIDKPIGSVLFHDTFGTHRLAAHAMVFPVVMLAIVMVATRPRSSRRRGLVGLVIGILFHLVLDGAWSDPETFWWPLFGWGFPPVADSAIGPLVARMIRDPWVWAGEGVGIAYLAYLWWRYLRAPGAVRAALATGRVPLPERG